MPGPTAGPQPHCSLHLSGCMEGVQFWFPNAVDAGSATAARALYLLHLSRAEVTVAHHWQEQTTSPTAGLAVVVSSGCVRCR
ncbi:hypothetical protein [Streptomyces sp. NPDC059176]|uniref:hypothetical protein n=1 Tax=Streptomyces sp. NPDC059176 TaxID=3346758 RepID=UPI0036AB312C